MPLVSGDPNMSGAGLSIKFPAVEP